jgi:hypothetical protein
MSQNENGAPAPVETLGQQMPPPPSWSASGAPPAMSAETMEQALADSRRIREFRIRVLQVWLQSQHKAAGVMPLEQSDTPYFEEWALHELWQISGGGTIECVRQPTRIALEGGHFSYECTWRAKHRYLGQVDGHGIATSGDKFLGTNEGGKSQKRALVAVNPHNIAQAASTRAKRSALEEILGTQGYTWPELHRLSEGRLPWGFDGVDADGYPIPVFDNPPGDKPPPAPRGQATPAKAAPAPAAPKPTPSPAPAAAKPSAAPAPSAEPTPDQLAQALPPDSWKKEPGPMPDGGPDNPVPPLQYIAKQVIGAKLLTPEELQAHAKLRRGFKGDKLQEANPELHGELAGDCVRCLKWIRAALPAWNKKMAEAISF